MEKTATPPAAPASRPSAGSPGIAFTLIWGGAAFALSFHLYGQGLAMSEKFGFSLKASCMGLLLVAWAFTPILGVWLIVCLMRNKSNRFLPALRIVASMGLLGCLCSEARVLADEAAFAKEAADRMAADGTPFHNRGRCWPNAGASLHYAAERGFRAND